MDDLYKIIENFNRATMTEGPTEWSDRAKEWYNRLTKSKKSEYGTGEKQAEKVLSRGIVDPTARRRQEAEALGCDPDDENCVELRKKQHAYHMGDDDQLVQTDKNISPAGYDLSEYPKELPIFSSKLLKAYYYVPYIPAAIYILNYALKKHRNWVLTYSPFVVTPMFEKTVEIAADWFPTADKTGYIEIEGPADSTSGNTRLYKFPDDNSLPDLFEKLVKMMPSPQEFDRFDESKITEDKDSDLARKLADEAYIRIPQAFRIHGDEYIMSLIDDVVQEADANESVDNLLRKLIDKITKSDVNEGAATVFSDFKGHHLKNADGEVVQSFDKTAEGLRAARNALYANYNVLSMEKPKESTMNEYEDKFNNALNESMTVTTTAGTDAPDTVNVNATDEDAHTLVAILKAAGLPYKDREAQLVAATPCGEQVEEEYANEPDEKTMSVDYMVNKSAGGLNRQKQQFKKEYPGDNPMAVNEENLMRGLWDLYKKV